MPQGSESRLRGAIEREDFELHYQPLVDGQTGKIVAAEALLRWDDSEIGRVSPQDFIPVAEETGLIVSIGAWVFRRACQQVATWRDAGLPQIRMGVNVSAHQIREPGMIEMVREVLDESLDKGWQEVWPRRGNDPKMLFVMGSNPLRRIRSFLRRREHPRREAESQALTLPPMSRGMQVFSLILFFAAGVFLTALVLLQRDVDPELLSLRDCDTPEEYRSLLALAGLDPS